MGGWETPESVRRFWEKRKEPVPAEMTLNLTEEQISFAVNFLRLKFINNHYNQTKQYYI
jgi:hypothetical protein